MKRPPSNDKLRGGYYTPEPIAQFLANWAVRSPSDRVLEPSCGDGAICVAAARRLLSLSKRSSARGGEIVAVELMRDEAGHARKAIQATGLSDSQFQVLNGDFFKHAIAWGLGAPLFPAPDLFDAAIGNPPFIRYQNFPESARAAAFGLMEKAGLHPNRLTNAWVPFLVVSAMLLKDTGRLAMVIPAELLQVSYAAEIRQFLSHFFTTVTLVTFRKLLFGQVQQDVVLVLAERAPQRIRGIRVVELESMEALSTLSLDADEHVCKALDHSTEKWTRYFLTPSQIELLRRLESLPSLRRFGHYASVDVGVVTGENSFFVLTGPQAESLGLTKFTQRLVSRSAQVRDFRYTWDDWHAALEAGAPVLLFTPPDVDIEELPPTVRNYVRSGQRANVHRGYKCAIRQRWYVVPSQWVPDAFALRQVHDFPRIALNEAGATATDTLHRVRFIDAEDPAKLAAAFVNSLTLAFAEVTGRSYGGGVLTFEPSEVEKLPVPLANASSLDPEEISRLSRANRWPELLETVDKVLLQDGLGLPPGDVRALRSAWEILRMRRQTRNKEKWSNKRLKLARATN